MTKIHFFLLICMALTIAMAACGSKPAANPSAAAGDEANTSVATGDEAGSDALSSSQPNVVTPDPMDVITLDNGDASGNGVAMRVLWTVSNYVIGRNASWDEQAAQALLFKPLDINDTQIIFDGKACQGVSFQQSTVNAADYLSSTWQTTPTELGIEVTELQVFKTNCGLPGFQEYMRLGDGRLIVPIKGVFFFFQPAVAR